MKVITFKQFLFESVNIDLKTLVTEKCSDFLSETKHSGLLYRGLDWEDAITTGDVFVWDNPESAHRSKLEYGIFNVRKDRQPFTSAEEFHDAYNRYFKNTFGWKPRSEAVFMTGSWNRSSAFGIESAVVFPIGNFKYLWSPSISDLLYIGNTVWDQKLNQLKTDEEIKVVLDGHNYQSDNLSKGITSGNEIMIDCTQFLAIRIDPAYKSKQIAAIKEVLEIE